MVIGPGPGPNVPQPFWRRLHKEAHLDKSNLGGGYFLTASINLFYKNLPASVNKKDRLHGDG
jgi:hypothetical protein